jgi:hypothetical protein
MESYTEAHGNGTSKKKKDKIKNRRLTAVKHVRLVVRNLVRNAGCCGIRNAWCWDPMNACFFLLAKRKGVC